MQQWTTLNDHHDCKASRKSTEFMFDCHHQLYHHDGMVSETPSLCKIFQRNLDLPWQIAYSFKNIFCFFLTLIVEDKSSLLHHLQQAGMIVKPKEHKDLEGVFWVRQVHYVVGRGLLKLLDEVGPRKTWWVWWICLFFKMFSLFPFSKSIIYKLTIKWPHPNLIAFQTP